MVLIDNPTKPPPSRFDPIPLLRCTSRLRSRWICPTPLDQKVNPLTGCNFSDQTRRKIVALGVIKRWTCKYKYRCKRAASPELRFEQRENQVALRCVEASLARLRVRVNPLSEQEFRALSTDPTFLSHGEEIGQMQGANEERLRLRKHPHVVKQLKRWMRLVEQPVRCFVVLDDNCKHEHGVPQQALSNWTKGDGMSEQFLPV